jgi:GTPase SAR1 family protein
MLPPDQTAPLPILSSYVLFDSIKKNIPMMLTFKDRIIDVLVIGNTKVGKSTWINSLLGAEYNRKQNEDGSFYAELKSPQMNAIQYAKIGEELRSETISPAAYEYNGLICGDTPGFDDNRPEETLICTAACMGIGLKIARSIRMLAILVDIEAFYLGTADELRRIVNHLEQLIDFGDRAKLLPHLAFIFTKNDIQKKNKTQILARIQKLVKDYETDCKELTRTIEATVGQPTARANAENSLKAKLSQLDVLIFMLKSDNLFIPDIFDQGQSRRGFLAMIGRIPALNDTSKTYFKVEKNNNWGIFKHLLLQMVTNGKNALDNYHHCSELLCDVRAKLIGSDRDVFRSQISLLEESLEIARDVLDSQISTFTIIYQLAKLFDFFQETPEIVAFCKAYEKHDPLIRDNPPLTQLAAFKIS